MTSSKVSATLLIVCFLIATAVLASAQRFVRAPIYSGGNPAASVASGDFNGDGNADIALLSNTTPGIITIRLGTGNGKFNPGQQITLVNSASSIIAGDWNNDGVLDLAASIHSFSVNAIAILLGNGDGTFTFQQSYDTGSQPGNFVSGDLNGDGIADLVAANLIGGGSVSVLLGLGGGKFSSAVLVATGYPPAIGVAVADVNLDGKLDIVAIGDDFFDGVSALSVLLGNGDGTFGSPSFYNTTYYAFGSPAVADFNHDGIPDVAVTGDLVSVYVGRGDGTFKPQVTYQGTPVIGQAMLAADLNKDGNVDLVSVDGFANFIAVLLGNGDGTFNGASLFGTGPCPKSLAVADFNKDGNLDVALPDSCDSNFVELVGDGTGKFTTRRDFDASPLCCSNIISVASGYLDADKNRDLVVVDGSSLNISLLPGNKNGAFRVGSTYFLKRGPTWATIADVNGDGKGDVITANSMNNTVSVLLGNGNGTLQAEIAYATADDPVFVAAADLNGDGNLDLVTANKRSNSFSVLLASGSGYQPHVDYTTASPLQFAFGDFNRDGKLDLVTVSGSGSANVFLGNGDGTFSPGVTLTVGGAPVSAAVGDLNNDGKLDLVIANSNSALIYSFLGNGDGTFQPQVTSAAPTAATQVMLGDFDADGKLDAVMVGGYGATAAAALLPGKGDGTFRQAQIFTVDYSPLAEVVGDFNSDGALDVVTANGTAGSVSVLLNTGK